MLADALDGTLSPADQATFDLHMIGCPSCSTMLADAQRGAAWMGMLKSSHPEPASDLIDRILAQTSGKAITDASHKIVLGANDYIRNHNTLLSRPALASSTPVPTAPFTTTNVLPFRRRITYAFRSLGHTMLQPRLAMTAAMAFFSIALTLNLTGVRLSGLRASDLKPSSILRSCYEAKAKVVRYSDNLRVVYELESRVRDLQHSSDDDGSTSTPAPQPDPAAQPGSTPTGNQQPDGKNPDQKQNRPRPKPGSSRREIPGGNLLQVSSSRQALSAAAHAFVVFTPSLNKQEGGLV
jgi:Putative zinc-finger